MFDKTSVLCCKSASKGSVCRVGSAALDKGIRWSQLHAGLQFAGESPPGYACTPFVRIPEWLSV